MDIISDPESDDRCINVDSLSIGSQISSIIFGKQRDDTLVDPHCCRIYADVSFKNTSAPDEDEWADLCLDTSMISEASFTLADFFYSFTQIRSWRCGNGVLSMFSDSDVTSTASDGASNSDTDLSL